ncbi:MAG: hypothetical protein AB1465_05745 [Patescibacteria group bacterium]
MNVHVPRGCMWIIETADNILTNYLQKYLEERIADLKIKNISNFDAFRTLITPIAKGIITKEKEELVSIALLKNPQRYLVKHAKKYEWLEYGLQGRILPFNHFVKELNKLKKKNPKKVLTQIKEETIKLARKQKEILKQLKIHPKHKKIFQIARDSMFYKVYAKDAQFFGYYCIGNLLREIGRRAGLTLEQIRFLDIGDYPKILFENKNYSQLTNERMKYSCHFSDRGKSVFYAGNQARKIMAKNQIL